MSSKESKKKVATVRRHSRRVPISRKNPDGTTVVDQHMRRLPGTFLDIKEIRSESGFREDPSENKTAFGITQITRETLKLLQDPEGEAKDFIFNNIRQRDLKNPEVAIPMAIRWLFRKRALAASKLKRAPNSEEIILEYKGLLKSKTNYKESGLKNFRENYAKLKSK